MCVCAHVCVYVSAQAHATSLERPMALRIRLPALLVYCLRVPHPCLVAQANLSQEDMEKKRECNSKIHIDVLI